MKKIRVVLIEDHELTRLGIRAALGQSNEVDIIGEAVNATDGLKLLEETKPDIALVDIGLPDLDGIELTKRFKAFLTAQEAPETKVLILTMQNQEELVLAAFAAGADSYCMKDASQDKLLQAVRLTYEGHAWLDPGIARIVLQQHRTQPAQDTGNEQTSTKASELDYSHSTEDYPLTAQEKELLELIVQGHSNASVAAQIGTQEGTVKIQVRNLLDKLSVGAHTQASVQSLNSDSAE